MAKLTLLDLVNLNNAQTAVSRINANNTLIETALENTLSRDGTSPNSMSADLDMNSNQILNCVDATTDQEPVTYGQFIDALENLADIGEVVKATQPEAEAATSNLVYMTPLRTAQTVQGATLFTNTGTGAAARTIPAWMKDRAISVKDFGCTGDGVTDDTTAFQAAVNAGSSTGRPVYIPAGSYKITTSILMPVATTLFGESYVECRILGYNAANTPTFRVVGTVNASGANYCTLRDFTIFSYTDGNDGVAFLWGGQNVMERVKIKRSDGSHRHRYAVIMDQQVFVKIDSCELQGFTDVGVYGPYTGEYTTYGTSTASYNNIISITNNQFNSLEEDCAAIVLHTAEDVLIADNNFNDTYFGIYACGLNTATITRNYHERLGVPNTSGPTVRFADASWINSTVSSRKNGDVEVSLNHVETTHDQPPNITDAVFQFEGGATGTFTIESNQLSNLHGHAVRLFASANGPFRLIYKEGTHQFKSLVSGYHEHVSNASADTSIEIEKWLNDTVTLSDGITTLGFNGQKMIYYTAIPINTDEAGELVGTVVSAGDWLISKTSGQVQRVTTGGVFGAPGAALAATTTSGSDVVSLAGISQGNVQRGQAISIAGAFNQVEVLGEYLDGSIRKLIMASNATGSVSSVAITWQNPTLQTLDAPIDADYLVKTTNSNLSAERAVTDTTSVIWDWATAGQAKATVPAASTTTSGIAELATDGEAQAKSDTGRTLTPSNLAALGTSTTFAGLVELATDGEAQAKSDTARALTPSNLAALGSSTSFAGLVELATQAEVDAGTSSTVAVTPSTLVGVPYVDAYLSANQTGITAGVETQINFDSTNSNVGSYFNTSTYAFTPPVGLYHVILTAYVDAGHSADGGSRVLVKVNGSQVAMHSEDALAGTPQPSLNKYISQTNASHAWTFFVRDFNGTDKTLTGGTGGFTFLQIRKVG